jgi:fumarate hydratase subunit beta
MNYKNIHLPQDWPAARSWQSGEWIRLWGQVYTARDASLKRIQEMHERQAALPADFKNSIIYFSGPTPAQPGRPIGACGPTTSKRMEKYFSLLNKLGVRAIIGKGPLTAQGKARLGPMLYFCALGGAGAVYAAAVKQAEIIAFPDLGPEAIFKLGVEDFPAVVAIDYTGQDLFFPGAGDKPVKGS